MVPDMEYIRLASPVLHNNIPLLLVVGNILRKLAELEVVLELVEGQELRLLVELVLLF